MLQCYKYIYIYINGFVMHIYIHIYVTLHACTNYIMLQTLPYAYTYIISFLQYTNCYNLIVFVTCLQTNTQHNNLHRVVEQSFQQASFHKLTRNKPITT